MMTDDQTAALLEASAACAAHNGRFDNPDCRIVLSVSAVTVGDEFFKLLLRFWGRERVVKLGLDPACVRAAIAGVNKGVAEKVQEAAISVGDFALFEVPADGGGGRRFGVDHHSEDGDELGRAEFATLPEALAFIRGAETIDGLL